jgi:hypothetical protein
MTVRNKTSIPARRQPTWDEIATDFRQVCQQWAGRGAELARLQEDLRETIDLWARTDRPAVARDEAEVGSKVDTGRSIAGGSAVSAENLAAQLAGALMPALCRQVSSDLRQVVAEHIQASRRGQTPPAEPGPIWSSLVGHKNKRARIRFDDIPAVIDALLAEERGIKNPPVAASHLVLAARPGKKTQQLKHSPSRLARGGHSHKH